jgi:hypothetical protein
MAGPQKNKKIKEEEKTTEESAFLAKKNSNYNTLIPMVNAEYVKVRHPFLGIDLHFKTNSQEFVDIFNEFSQKGLGEKLKKELILFAEQYDKRWFDVLKHLQA